MTPTVSNLTGFDYATLAFQRSFTLETPSKIGEAVKTTGKPRTLGLLGCKCTAILSLFLFPANHKARFLLSGIFYSSYSSV